jgi:hypothetical protein
MIQFRDDNHILKEAYSNKRFWDIKGALSESDAKVSLVDFLKNNIDFTIQLLFGFQVFPFQSYILSQWLSNNFCINIWSRGASKSWLSALFCGLYAVFNPEKKIVLTSNSFRSSRAVMDQLEKFVNAPGAELLKQCFPYDLRRHTDVHDWNLAEGGFIKAVPLNEKIRGHRADVLFCDEGLLISKDLMEGTIKPFLLSRESIQEQLQMKEQEDYLIKQGVLTELDRTIFESTKKMIILSSASFEFQYLHEIYQDWKSKTKDSGGKYFVSRLSYLALPKELVEENIVKEAESQGVMSSYFQREYMARFPSASDGYFNLQHMHECTIPDGDEPCVQIVGIPNVKYILSIDPSFSSSKTSDSFAMGVFMLDENNKTVTLVNSYGVAGGSLSQHVSYLYHIIKSFNIVMITADLLGGQGEARGFNFIQSANMSNLFMENGVELKFFEGCLDDCGEDYVEEMRLMRKTYNKENKAYCYTQGNKPAWKLRANEYMQHFIQRKQLFFCSRIVPNEKEFSRFSNYQLPFTMKNSSDKQMSITDFCSEQDDMIEETKSQIALITPRVSPSGHMTFDLAPEVKSIKGENRARRDNYTTTLMAVWAAKFYFDFLDESVGKKESWKPYFLN